MFRLHVAEVAFPPMLTANFLDKPAYRWSTSCHKTARVALLLVASAGSTGFCMAVVVADLQVEEHPLRLKNIHCSAASCPVRRRAKSVRLVPGEEQPGFPFADMPS